MQIILLGGVFKILVIIIANAYYVPDIFLSTLVKISQLIVIKL